MPKGDFRGLTHHMAEAARARKMSPARANLLPPVRAFNNHVTNAAGHALKGDPASLGAASRSREHAAGEITTLEVALAGARATLQDLDTLIKRSGGGAMAKGKDQPEGTPYEDNEGENFKRDAEAPEVSGEPYSDPSQSNIGAQRAGKEAPADVEADNAETADVQDEQEAAEKKAARAAKKKPK